MLKMVSDLNAVPRVELIAAFLDQMSKRNVACVIKITKNGFYITL